MAGAGAAAAGAPARAHVFEVWCLSWGRNPYPAKHTRRGEESKRAAAPGLKLAAQALTKNEAA